VKNRSQAVRENIRLTDLLTASVRRQEAAERRALSLKQRFRAEILSITAAYVGVYSAIRQFVGIVEAFTFMEAATNRLRVVFGNDLRAIGREITWLRSEANRLGLNFKTLSTEYTKFAVVIDQSPALAGRARELFV